MMGLSKALIASLLLSLVILQGVEAQVSNAGTMPGAGSGTESKIDCGAACEVRCSASKRPNYCRRACGTCCSRCECVPPGTSGNYEACPCYASLTTHGGQHKCP